MKRSYGRPVLCGVVLAVLLACSYQAPMASAITYDHTPRESLLLQDSQRFIAQDSWNSVALYRVEDAGVIHRFMAASYINKFAITSDERFLLVACAEGSLSLWEIDSGHALWGQSGRQTGLKYIYDASFADNGQSFVVGDIGTQALVFETLTGRRLRAIGLPSGEATILSIALSPDGRAGILSVVSDQLYMFDVETGDVTDTGLRGRPVRYARDGRYIACRRVTSGGSHSVSILAVKDHTVKFEAGEFISIGQIKPSEDNRFLVTALVENKLTGTYDVMGMQVAPDSQNVRYIWKLPVEKKVNPKTDFLPQGIIGISTDFRLVTHVTELRDGRSLHVIDNSENYRPIVVTTTSSDEMGLLVKRFQLWITNSWLGLTSAGVCIAVGIATVMLYRRRRRRGYTDH